MLATASLVTFAFISGDICASPPLVPSATGVAEPMLVVGAMPTRFAAYEMYTPAEPARAPSGATYTITGTLELRMRRLMSRIASDRPPGVSM